MPEAALIELKEDVDLLGNEVAELRGTILPRLETINESTVNTLSRISNIQAEISRFNTETSQDIGIIERQGEQLLLRIVHMNSSLTIFNEMLGRITVRVDDLETAVADLEASVGTRIDDLESYTGSFGSSFPFYSSSVYVSGDLTNAIGALDYNLYDNVVSIYLAINDVWDEIDFQNTYMGKAGQGYLTPTYSSSEIVSGDLTNAIGSLDYAVYNLSLGVAGEFINIHSFIGKSGMGVEMPSYTSTKYVSSSTSLVAAISDLDYELDQNVVGIWLGITDLVNEDGYIQNFIGKSGNGSSMPTYWSTQIVSNGTSLTTAIGALDLSLYNLSLGVAGNVLELGYIRSFIGKNAAGVEVPVYSSTNYVSGDLETAIGALDTAVKDRENEEGYIRSFVGKTGAGEELPLYWSSYYASGNLEVAIGDLDYYLYIANLDIGNLKTDVSTLQSDMSTAQSDIATLQSQVSWLQSNCCSEVWP